MKKSFGEKLKNLFSKKIDEEFFEELTDSLVEGDIGAKTAFEITDELEQICRQKKISEQKDILAELKQLLLKNIREVTLEPDMTKQKKSMSLSLTSYLKAICLKAKKLNVMLDSVTTAQLYY